MSSNIKSAADGLPQGCWLGACPGQPEGVAEDPRGRTKAKGAEAGSHGSCSARRGPSRQVAAVVRVPGEA